jgi:hypothetical protein
VPRLPSLAPLQELGAPAPVYPTYVSTSTAQDYWGSSHIAVGYGSQPQPAKEAETYAAAAAEAADTEACGNHHTDLPTFKHSGGNSLAHSMATLKEGTAGVQAHAAAHERAAAAVAVE